MNVVADLHTHTTASDGQYPPTELVYLAKQYGVQVLAVTDHDTIAGVDEAIAAGAGFGPHPVYAIIFFEPKSGKEQHYVECKIGRMGTG